MEKLFQYISADVREVAKLGDSVGNWTPQQSKRFDELSERTLATLETIQFAVLDKLTEPK